MGADHTDEQAQSGAGLDAQRAAILSESIRRGWTIVRIIEDAGLSGKTMSRPGLEEAITMFRAGEADILVAAKLDRISRSALGFLQLAKQSQTEGWQLRVLDADLDTSTPMGRFAIGILALVAELERDLIAQRTKDALAARKAKGMKLGRPVRDTKTRGRIVALRASGATYQEIVETLASDVLPEGQPRKVWSISSVRNVCKAAGCNTRGLRVRVGSSTSLDTETRGPHLRLWRDGCRSQRFHSRVLRLIPSEQSTLDRSVSRVGRGTWGFWTVTHSVISLSREDRCELPYSPTDIGRRINHLLIETRSFSASACKRRRIARRFSSVT